MREHPTGDSLPKALKNRVWIINRLIVSDASGLGLERYQIVFGTGNILGRRYSLVIEPVDSYRNLKISISSKKTALFHCDSSHLDDIKIKGVLVRLVFACHIADRPGHTLADLRLIVRSEEYRKSLLELKALVHEHNAHRKTARR